MPVTVEPAELRVNLEASSFALGSCRVREPATFADLPDSVQRNVRALLLDLVGAEYLARLEFVGGQVIDPIEYSSGRRRTRDDCVAHFAHRVGYRMSLPEIGVDSYIGYVTIDIDGRLDSPIEFPPVRADPSKAALITVDSARAVARGVGLHPERVQMEYRGSDRSLAYVFEQVVLVRPRYGGGKIRFVAVDAHSGRVLDDRTVDYAV